jgi:hypothetical protein
MPTRKTVAETAGLGGVIAKAAQAPKNVLRVSFIVALFTHVLAPLSHCPV